MSEIKKLTKKIVDFRNARDWEQFHNPKDLALSLVLESSEVMEHFQWKNKEEVDAYIKASKTEIGEELADVLCYAFLLAHALKIDLLDAFNDKLEKSGKKYPVEKAKGKHTKYNQL
jgi:NTP pyrophosphatase (non-canonical NTP hydrolase)